MMPFYGNTPAEAAQLLAKWLTLAHARVQGTQATVISPAAADSA